MLLKIYTIFYSEAQIHLLFHSYGHFAKVLQSLFNKIIITSMDSRNIIGHKGLPGKRNSKS